MYCHRFCSLGNYDMQTACICVLVKETPALRHIIVRNVSESSNISESNSLSQLQPSHATHVFDNRTSQTWQEADNHTSLTTQDAVNLTVISKTK